VFFVIHMEKALHRRDGVANCLSRPPKDVALGAELRRPSTAFGPEGKANSAQSLP
jgi:hypothetical protein